MILNQTHILVQDHSHQLDLIQDKAEILNLDSDKAEISNLDSDKAEIILNLDHQDKAEIIISTLESAVTQSL